MAARPPSCSSFQASQPPTLRPSRFFLLFSRFGSSLRFDALRCCFCFCRSFSSLARRAPDAMAPLALQAPRTSNAASASAPQRPSDVFFNEKREASRPSLSFFFLFLFLIFVFVFARFLFSFPRLKPTSPTRRLEPPRRDGREKAGSPTLLNPRPELSPACPEHFCSQP